MADGKWRRRCYCYNGNGRKLQNRMGILFVEQVVKEIQAARRKKSSGTRSNKTEAIR